MIKIGDENMGLKEKLFGKKQPKIQDIEKGNIKLTKIKYMKSLSTDSYVYSAQKRINGKKESSVIFGLPKDISKFRGDYGAEPIIELAAMETNKNGGNIYLGTIGEGKDNLFHIDEDIPAMAALHTRDFRAMRKNAKRFNDKNFATSKTRFNIKNKPRLESKFCNGKMLYTINDMKTGLLIRLENVESMKNIELGENLLYSAKLSYKHVNDNEVTASRRVAFELYTAMEFIQSKSEAELLGNFFSQKK